MPEQSTNISLMGTESAHVRDLKRDAPATKGLVSAEPAFGPVSGLSCYHRDPFPPFPAKNQGGDLTLNPKP